MASDTPNTPAPPKGAVQLKVRMDDDVAQGSYANVALVVHSESEFVLDFMFVQPNRAEAKVNSRVILSPLHAKRLLAALVENVARYEARHGTIPLPKRATDGSPN